MRWCIWLIALLVSRPCLAADWWWKDFVVQPNQVTTLHDPSQSDRSVCVLQNPAAGGTDCASSTPYGPGSSLATQPPVILVGKGMMGGVREVAAGSWHPLALKRDGTVYGAGDNTYGQLGTGDNSTMLGSWTKVVTGMRDIAACSYFSLAIGTDGTVWEAGDNTWGEQGDGTTNPINNTWHQALKKDSSGNISPMDNTLHVACGERHALAIRNDGTLWAIGDGTYGQTGRGDTPQYWQQVPIAFTPATVAAGAFHSLVIDTAQQLWVAGDNQYGEIGAGGGVGAVSPFGMVLSGPVLMVAGGWRHSIALMADGSLMVTGDNGFGQLGTNNYASQNTWLQEPGYTGITQIAARDNQSFLIANRQLYATGNNNSVQLGLKAPPNTMKRWKAALTPVTQVAPGVAHTLVINAGNQQVWATGDNSYGQLGLLNPTATNSPPWVSTMQ